MSWHPLPTLRSFLVEQVFTSTIVVAGVISLKNSECAFPIDFKSSILVVNILHLTIFVKLVFTIFKAFLILNYVFCLFMSFLLQLYSHYHLLM